MNIVVLHFRDISDFPPVQKLISSLLNLKHKVFLITFDRNDYCKKINGGIETLILQFDGKKSRFSHFWGYLKNRKTVKSALKKMSKKYDLIWTTTDSSIAVAGDLVYCYDRYVMQLMEFVLDTPRYPAQKIMMLGLSQYARKAFRVVVPEKTRGLLFEAAWKIDKKVFVLPNKSDIPSIGRLPDEYIPVLFEIERLKQTNKKIVLYQGIFSPERRLDEIADYLDRHRDQFSFCILGVDNVYRRNFCQHHSNAIYLGYVPSPYHLAITAKADIGLLIYDAQRVSSFDEIINNMFCAPNKIFEFAKFGIPMIGNEVPGLENLFYKFHIGVSCSICSMNSIENAFKSIERNYCVFKEDCLRYYSSIHMENLIEEILQ